MNERFRLSLGLSFCCSKERYSLECVGRGKGGGPRRRVPEHNVSVSLELSEPTGLLAILSSQVKNKCKLLKCIIATSKAITAYSIMLSCV